MSIIQREELRELFEVRRPCVSIYMPTVRAGVETEQNPIRFRNLVTEAERQLAELDGGGDADALLADAKRRIDDDDFWQHPRNGLAYLYSEEVDRSYRLPHDPGELAVVANRFHLKPLLPLLTRGGRFYVLALSRGSVRLLECTPDRAAEVDLGHALPESLQDALGYDRTGRSLQLHGQSRHAGARSEAIFHGHGAGSDDRESELRRFLEILDDGLETALGDEDAPIVLAGVEEVTAMFRKVSKSRRLTAESVPGNADEASPEQLHRAAWERVAKAFAKEREQDAERFQELRGTERASSTLDDVLRAAHDGRVETIFVPLEKQIWGSYSPSERSVELADQNGDHPASEDLLDLAAVRSLDTGAKVYALKAEEMPGEAELAALFRY